MDFFKLGFLDDDQFWKMTYSQTFLDFQSFFDCKKQAIDCSFHILNPDLKINYR